MKKENLKKISLKLTSNREDFMSAFRKNIYMYVEEKDMTLREIADLADIQYKTLTNFLYSDSKDCNLSTAVKLARAFGISVDELIGAETIGKETRECVAMARNLKDHHRHVIRSFVRYQYDMHCNTPSNSKQISVFVPDCEQGHLKTTNVTEPLNIDHLQENIKARVCSGLRIPCEHYEPYYMPEEIILLAADRDGMNNERCIVRCGGNYYICIKKIEIENGIKTVKYLSIMDKKNVIFSREDIDEKMGYIIGFLFPDGEWGVR